MTVQRHKYISFDDAETIALKALTFIAKDEALFKGFLLESGISGQSLRDSLSDIYTLMGILKFLLEREKVLISFCKFENIAPDLPARARTQLAGEDRNIHFIQDQYPKR